MNEHVIDELLERPVADWADLSEHLERCQECGAFADGLRTAERRVRDDLDRYATAVAFDTAWAAATRHRRSRPMGQFLQTVALALAVAAALVLALQPRGAEPTWSVEEAPARAEDTLNVYANMSLVLAFPHEPWRVTVDGDAVRAVALEPPDRLQIVGVTEGTATLRISFEDAPDVRFEVVVGPPLQPEGVSPADDVWWLRVGETGRFALEEDLAGLFTTDPATVALRRDDGEVVLRGLRAGVTDVWGFDEDGQPHAYRVVVAPR